VGTAAFVAFAAVAVEPVAVLEEPHAETATMQQARDRATTARVLRCISTPLWCGDRRRVRRVLPFRRMAEC
jgi:hypothetical protein